MKLDDWKGTRLLTFWSETCGRCVAELKEFEKLAEANPDKVQLIAINVDGDKVDTKAVVAKRQLTLPVIKDQLKNHSRTLSTYRYANKFCDYT